MDKTKIISIVFIAGLMIVGVAAIVYLLFFDKKETSSGTYPSKVQQVIDNPIEKNGDWSTLANNDDYQISYSKGREVDAFFITVNAAPALNVSKRAEQELVNKLGITQDEICALPVIIKVTAASNPNLTGFNFGLSFCPDRIHIADVPQDTPPDDGLKDPGA